MATVYSKALLTGCTDGKPHDVSATVSGSATTVHTAVSGTTNFHEVYVFAYNTTANECLLTMMYGATEVATLIPGRAIVEVLAGVPLQNGVVIKAFGAVASSIKLMGFANLLTVS